MDIHINDKRKNLPGNIFFWFSVICVAAAVLIMSDRAAALAYSAVILCAKTVIPALLPFLVLNGMLIHSGFAEKLGKLIGKPFSALFGVSGACAAAGIAGAFCGYPIGAAVSYSIYKRGLCKKSELERLIAFCNNAGPAFLIAGIGGSMLGSTRRGLALWIFQLTSSFVVGMIFNFVKKNPGAAVEYYSYGEKRGIFSCIAVSVREAAEALVGICGSVVFFSVLSGLLTSFSFIPDTAKCFIAAFFEVTSASALSASLLSPDMALIVIAAAVGWSGISVHSQTAMVTHGEAGLSKYLSGKVLCALLTAFFAALAVQCGVL